MNVRIRAALVMALVIIMLALASMACLPPCKGEGCQGNGCALCID